MSTDLLRFDPKDPEEIVPLTFDFASLAPSPSNPAIVLSRHSGAEDASDLTAMLVGSPQVVGSTVRQKVQGGVNGTNYKVRCRIDTPEGYRWAEAVLLPVESA